MIREGNQRLVSASVVPVERPRGFEKRRHYVEDALESRDLGSFVLVHLSFARCEEGGGRELVSVARDHGLSPAEQGCRGILGQDLTCLVKNNDVEEGALR